MSTHDELCPATKRIDPHYDTQGSCHCDLIAAVEKRTTDRLCEQAIFAPDDSEFDRVVHRAAQLAVDAEFEPRAAGEMRNYHEGFGAALAEVLVGVIGMDSVEHRDGEFLVSKQAVERLLQGLVSDHGEWPYSAGKRAGLEAALAVVDKGGRAAFQIQTLLDEVTS